MKIRRALLAMVAALPAYSSFAELSADEYLTRAKFVEGVLVADHLQIVVGVYFVTHNDVWPTSINQAAKEDPTDPVPELPTKTVQSASLGPNGTITITFRSDVARLGGKSFVMSPTPRPDGGIAWKCSAPDIPEVYRSQKCRFASSATSAVPEAPDVTTEKSSNAEVAMYMQKATETFFRRSRSENASVVRMQALMKTREFSDAVSECVLTRIHPYDAIALGPLTMKQRTNAASLSEGEIRQIKDASDGIRKIIVTCITDIGLEHGVKLD